MHWKIIFSLDKFLLRAAIKERWQKLWCKELCRLAQLITELYDITSVHSLLENHGSFHQVGKQLANKKIVEKMSYWHTAPKALYIG